LVAEDHPTLARSIADGLRDEGYAVDLTFDGNEALHLAASNPYDAVVLDVMLPGRDGFTIIQTLRRRDVRTPILCLTALLIGLFVARPLINRMFTAQALAAATGGGGFTRLTNTSPVAGSLPAPSSAEAAAAAAQTQEGAPALPAPKSSIDVSRIDGQVRESSIKKVGEVVTAHPEEALAIIRTWLHQPV